MNLSTWLGLPWILGPHSLSVSRSFLLSLSCTHRRRFANLKMWLSEISSKILWCWGAVSSCSCQAGKLSNTERLCWPGPLANLGCRQHRVLGDLNRSVKVSAAPTFSPHARIFFILSPPPASFIWPSNRWCFFILKGYMFSFLIPWP